MRLIIEMILLRTLLQQHKERQQIQYKYSQIMDGFALYAEEDCHRIQAYAHARMVTVGI